MALFDSGSSYAVVSDKYCLGCTMPSSVKNYYFDSSAVNSNGYFNDLDM